MKGALLIFVSIVLTLPLSAQEINFDMPDTHQQERKHLKAIDPLQVDSSAMEQIRLRASRIAVDSLRNYVEVPGITIDSTLSDQITSKAYSKGQRLLENETGIAVTELAIDSTAMNHLKADARLKLRSAAKDNLEMEIPNGKADSTFIKDFRRQAELKAEGALRDTDEFKALDISDDSEFADLKGYKEKAEQTAEEVRQAAVSKELKQKMVAQGKEYIIRHADKIQQVQSRMAEVKEKYASVIDSKDLSTATKRTSLRGAPLLKRLVLGGNFNVGKLDPVTIDLSPVLGYRFNKRFEAGITGIYRAQLQGYRNNLNPVNDRVYGYSVFVSHTVFRNFFGYLEGEKMNRVQPAPEVHTSEWEESLLIGIGRKVKVASWLELQGLVLFNALHDNHDGMYNNPVVFKTAVRFRK